MGKLYTSDLDRLRLGYFKEAASLKGTTVYFYKTISEYKDIYTDIDIVKEAEPRKVDILFEQYPVNIKTLKKYGWYSVDGESNPHTAYVPLDLTTLNRWQEVLIPARIVGDGEGLGWRRFHVTKMQTTMDHPSYYLIALAPVFEDNAPAIDREKNTTFIDLDNVPAL